MPKLIKRNVCILDVDYVLEEERPIIRIWGKTDKGESIVIFDFNFEPYFYIEPVNEGDINSIKEGIRNLKIYGEEIKRIEVLEKKVFGKNKKVIKLVVKNPRKLSEIRDIVKEWDDIENQYEYAISFYHRYLIDKNLVPMSWITVSGEERKTDLNIDLAIGLKEIKFLEKEDYPDLKILVFDLEVSGDEIIMASLMDNKGFKKVLTYGFKSKKAEILRDERELISRFIEIVKENDPDIIVGYNTDRFDFLKLREKSEKYKIPLRLGRDDRIVIFRRRGRISSATIKGRIHIDLYDFIEHILSPSLSSEVLTLDVVAKELLGFGKKPVKWKEIEDAWREKKDLEKIIKYCEWDSELTLKLADYLLPQIYELSKVTGQLLFDTSRYTYSQLVEGLLVREAFKRNYIIPNRPKTDEILERKRIPPYTGGYVHPPIQGLHDNIGVFDFRSLYPSIIISKNISPETLNCECCKGRLNNKVPDKPYYFCKKEKGFIPLVLEQILKKRIEIKEKMKGLKKNSQTYKYLYNRQYALKILANASYGYFGYFGSRWYSRECAESIAAWGRYYIKNVIKFAEKEKFKVIYGDTDSLFLKIKNEKEAKEFLEKVNKTLPGEMELEFQGFYKTGLFVSAKTGLAAKKKYALLGFDGSLVIRGFEKVRRDWCNIAKETQEEILRDVLENKKPEKSIEIVREKINALREGKVNMDDLIIYTQITRPLSQYEQIGPHVAAAKKLLNLGVSIGEGSIISYIITKGVGSISSRAVPAEFAENYDPEYYIHNQVIPAAMRILSGLGIKEEELLPEAKKQESLGKFFK